MTGTGYCVNATVQPTVMKEEGQHQMLSYHDATARSRPTEFQCPQSTAFSFSYPHFTLLYINRNGELQVESSPSISSHERAIFTQDVKEKFLKSAGLGWQSGLHSIQQPSSVGHMEGDVTEKQPSFLSNSFGPHHDPGWYQPGLIPCEWQSLHNKRPRRNSRRMESGAGRGSDPSSPGSAVNWTALRVGQKDLLQRYYERAFENFQQINCRAIAKAFVKLVEPRKQVNHPYNGRRTVAGSPQRVDPELTKPKWWPAGVTHREPDHLVKAERIRLLVYILCELRESHAITADKLKEAGQDVRRSISPPERLQILDEIYYVRDMEELYLDGKISGDTMIHVSQVHMAEASLISGSHDQAVPMIAVEGVAPHITEHQQQMSPSGSHYLIGGSSNNNGVISDNDHLPSAQEIYEETSSPEPYNCLTPGSTPSASRRSSVEGSLVYSSNMASPRSTTSEPSRTLCPPRNGLPLQPSSIPTYYTQQMVHQPAGQTAQFGFWNQITPNPQPSAFQGY